MVHSTRRAFLASLPLVAFVGRGRAEEEAEWTAERALRVWRPMTRAVQHVGVPGYQFQAGVLWNGALYFGPDPGLRKDSPMREEAAHLGENGLHISVGYGDSFRIPDRAARGIDELTQELEDGYLPIPTVRFSESGLEWKQRTFGHLLDRQPTAGMQPEPSDVLVVEVSFAAVNRSPSAKTARLWLHFGEPASVRFGYKSGQANELSKSIDHRFESPFGISGGLVRYILPPPSLGELHWHEVGPVPEDMSKASDQVIEWRTELAPGATAQLRMIVPYQAIMAASAKKLLNGDPEPLHTEVRKFYSSLASGIGSITTPDRFINDYLLAVPSQMTQQIAYRHQSKIWMYKTSPNHYELYWPCNAAKALPTLDLRGLSAYSRPVLKSYVDTQSEDYGKLTREMNGKAVSGDGFARVPGFLGNFGPWTANTLLLSHGLEMWALAAHYRITRDSVWLGSGAGSPLNALVDGFDWVMAQRRRTMYEKDGRKVPHWGLLPAASAHDWLSGNTIFNDAFCIFGMTETVRLLREIMHPRAAELADNLGEYRKCLKQRYSDARDKARRVPIPGGKSIPYVPRDVYELDWAKLDWTYTGYGPLRAGAWGVLDPYDELVNQSLEFLMKGMPKGEGYYFKAHQNAFEQPTADVNFLPVADPEADRHHLWRHYVEYETMWPIGMDLFLQRDDLPRFFEWFFNNMAMVLHRNFRVGVESLDGVPSNAPGEGERWRAVRNMFVNERGGYDGSTQSLWLMQAIPREWLKPGNRIGVKEMGTHFGGRVNLEAVVSTNGDIVVHADLKLATKPSEVKLRLRSGDGRKLREATVNGVNVPLLEGETIQLPDSNKHYRVVARF